ncbi:MAG TPA: excinuclease ABC subunit UvrB, partial [Kiritimatiellia bacterium]|nr:excinuclease ABC subunit UvrB [Kiritimatiellia bacterium]
TNALLGRRDVVIVASVSCIYGLGSPEDYREMLVDLTSGCSVARDAVLEQLVGIQYVRNDYEPQPGTFRVRGDSVDIFPSYETDGLRVTFFGDEVESLHTLDPVTGRTGSPLSRVVISPAKHFVMPRAKIDTATSRIACELDARLAELERQGKLLEAQRLRQRTDFDLEMLRELGYCNGIENYSRHLAGRVAGEPPACLLDYFEGEFLTILDESHVTVPQLRAMYNGDQARKQTLVEHGFRLPSAQDNRPLRFEEFLDKVGPIVFASATPGPYERQVSEITVEQVIRPTGLLDPPVEIRPLDNQIDNLIEEIRRAAEQGDRVLVTTLTKRSAEDLTAYLTEIGIRVEYLHSDIGAIDRVAILGRLRTGAFDCLIGINLLREGLDLPEVALVAVLDADKEGFLRSATSLIQTAGRTARHVNGRVILYADRETEAIRKMVDITRTRRQRQEAFNATHGITPQSVRKALNESLDLYAQARHIEERMFAAESSESYDLCRAIADTEAEMIAAADALEFERAALLRDELRELKHLLATPAGPETDGAKSTKPKNRRTRRPQGKGKAAAPPQPAGKRSVRRRP